MICDQVELRLLKLLDKRSSVAEFLGSGDPLALHCQVCSSCAEMAAAFDLLATKGIQAEPLVPPCPDLADRVVAALHSPEATAAVNVPRREAPAAWPYHHAGSLIAAALAACVMVAITLQWPAATDTPVAEQVASPTTVAAVEPAGADLPRQRAAAQEETPWYPRGWGLTSISLAMIRSHTSPEVAREEVAGEPLFERAVEMLRQVWHDLDQEPQTPSSETGFYNPASPLWV